MANYAVIRMEKYKKDRLNGTQKHNQREFQKAKMKTLIVAGRISIMILLTVNRSATHRRFVKN
ncbi:plasmid recombination protein [Bacillus velezensis]|nr:plasmid recombination protein [Bacillus velezensis]